MPLGGQEVPSWLNCFAPDKPCPRQAYYKFVFEGLLKDKP